jgi:hypothetical protein
VKRCFGETYHLHLEGRNQPTRCSETSLHIRATQCYIPEDGFVCILPLVFSSTLSGAVVLWEPSTGTSHSYTNRYPSNSLINTITVVTNRRSNTGIVTSSVYAWSLNTSAELYVEEHTGTRTSRLGESRMRQ